MSKLLLTILNKGGTSKYSSASIKKRYFLYDKFTSPVSAGIISGTFAQPVGGARITKDSNNRFSILGGELLAPITSGTNTDPSLYYAQSFVRTLGRTFLVDKISTNAVLGAVGADFGWHGAPGVTKSSEGLIWVRAPTLLRCFDGGNAVDMGLTIVTGTSYHMAVSLRNTGAYYFIKGGTYVNWVLGWASTVSSSTPLYPHIAGGDVVGLVVDTIKVPKKLYTPIPIQSDSFSSITTDGRGNQEFNGIVGNVWSNSAGTWQVNSGTCSASALSVTGSAIRTINGTTPDIVQLTKLNRSGGSIGVVFRYQDPSNYLVAYHDGTNAKVDKVIGGVATNVISAVTTYVANAILVIIADRTSIRMYYNNAIVGTVQTVTNFSTSTQHGLYTTNLGNFVDDYQLFARGYEGQYTGLDSL